MSKPVVYCCLNASLSPSIAALGTLENVRHEAMIQGIGCIMYATSGSGAGFLDASKFAYHFIKNTEATHLMFLCDDAIFPQNAIVKLVTDDKDIVHPIYRKRDGFKSQPAIYLREPDRPHFIEYMKNGTLVQTDFAASHGMLIKRHVIEAMMKHYTNLNWYDHGFEDEVCGLFMPEIQPDKELRMDDWIFSQRARALGFEVWADFSVKLLHRSIDIWLEFGDPDKMNYTETTNTEIASLIHRG